VPREEKLRERNAAVRRVLIITMVLNLVVAAAKAIYGVWSGALAITTDAVHSVVDAVSNIIGLVAVRLASAPPDSDHPYGHHKVEMVAAAAIGVAVGATAVRFAWDAVDALVYGRPVPTVTTAGFVIIVGTWVINMFVAAYEGRKAKEYDSAYLAADAAHTASDVLVTGAVLISFTAAYYGVEWADPVGALVVVLVIARVAWKVLYSNLAVLVDRAVVDPARVRKLAEQVEGVIGCHRVRSRGTEGAAHVDLHLLLDGDLSLRKAHDIGHQVEDVLRAEIEGIADVTVHTEPEEAGHEGL
jgi:cation diffusion facilitator family transporter